MSGKMERDRGGFYSTWAWRRHVVRMAGHEQLGGAEGVSGDVAALFLALLRRMHTPSDRVAVDPEELATETGQTLEWVRRKLSHKLKAHGWIETRRDDSGLVIVALSQKAIAACAPRILSPTEAKHRLCDQLIAELYGRGAYGAGGRP